MVYGILYPNRAIYDSTGRHYAATPLTDEGLALHMTTRERVGEQHPCLLTALDEAVPTTPEQREANPMQQLTYSLLFEKGNYHDTYGWGAFADTREELFDHGLRQFALASEVMEHTQVERLLPDWHDPQLFGSFLLTADVGLVFVPDEEVEVVHAHGQRHAQYYSRHPHYGHGMAESFYDLRAPGFERARMLSILIGRHHNVQARHADGPSELEYGLHLPGSPGLDIADLTVMSQKPFDYIDDIVSRARGSGERFEQRVEAATRRFLHGAPTLYQNNADLEAAANKHQYPLSLQNTIAQGIEAQLLHSRRGVSEVYRAINTKPILVTT